MSYSHDQMAKPYGMGLNIFEETLEKFRFCLKILIFSVIRNIFTLTSNYIKTLSLQSLQYYFLLIIFKKFHGESRAIQLLTNKTLNQRPNLNKFSRGSNFVGFT